MKQHVIALILFTGFTILAQNPEKSQQLEPKISSDNNYVYINLMFKEPRALSALLHTGFYVYFDTKGKKKKNVSVRYPLIEQPIKRMGPPPQKGYRVNQEKQQEQKRQHLSKILEDLPREAEYNYFDLKETFNLDLNAQDISINFDITEHGAVVYNLKIPKTAITLKTNNLSKLSVGIVSVKPMNKDGNQSAQFSLGNSGGKGRRQQGSKLGGGQRGGSRQKARDSKGKSDQERPKQSKSIAIWVDANLNS